MMIIIMVKYLIKFVNFINVGEIVGLELPPRLPLCFHLHLPLHVCVYLSLSYLLP